MFFSEIEKCEHHTPMRTYKARKVAGARIKGKITKFEDLNRTGESYLKGIYRDFLIKKV